MKVLSHPRHWLSSSCSSREVDLSPLRVVHTSASWLPSCCPAVFSHKAVCFSAHVTHHQLQFLTWLVGRRTWLPCDWGCFQISGICAVESDLHVAHLVTNKLLTLEKEPGQKVYCCVISAYIATVLSLVAADRSKLNVLELWLLDIGLKW